MPWVAIVERARLGMGRGLNKTYINVLSSVRQLQETASEFVANNPTHPWVDSQFREFIVDLTEQQAQDIRDGSNPLAWDDKHNEPRWQQQNDGSGSTPSFGSWADPEDDQSTWRSATPIPDDRWIVRLYDGDPGVSGVHIGVLNLDEDSFGGEKTIHLKLFNANDTPSGTNAQDQKTEIAGVRMIFDFTAGVTTLGVETTIAGQMVFPSNHSYRVIGPSGEKEVLFNVFGRSLKVSS